MVKKHFIQFYTDNKTPIILPEERILKNKDLYAAQNVRPVFKSERILLKYLFPSLKDYDKYLWKSSDRNIFFKDSDNKVNVPISKIQKLVADKKTSEYCRNEMFEALENEDYSLFDKAVEYNSNRLIDLFEDSKDIVCNLLPQQYDISKGTEIVSFSGGKDSTLVSHIIRRIRGTNEILHCFGDTTLEDPNTYKYIQRFSEDNPLVPLLETYNDKNFFDMCKQIGPPSRVNRWCCSIFKTGPIDDEYNMLVEEDQKKLLFSYIGIRKSESSRRSKYNLIDKSPKIEGQIAIHLIFNWTDFDVFLYFLKHKIDFNDSYRLGFNRVGCWCCPMNSFWSDALYRLLYPEQANEWRNYLIEFAKKSGKKDAEVYVDTKKWAARHGGDGLDKGFKKINYSMCGDAKNVIRYRPHKKIDNNFFEYLKPLGFFNFIDLKNENQLIIYKNKTNSKIRFILNFDSDNSIKIISQAVKQNLLKSEFSLFKNQIVKYENCIYCGACSQHCKHNSIICSNNTYSISESCIKCGDCIKIYDKGCLAAKSTILSNN